MPKTPEGSSRYTKSAALLCRLGAELQFRPLTIEISAAWKPFLTLLQLLPGISRQRAKVLASQLPPGLLANWLD